MFPVFWHLGYELACNKDSDFKDNLLRTTTSVETEIGWCQINMRGMMGGKKSQSVLFYFNLTYSLTHTERPPLPPLKSLPSAHHCLSSVTGSSCWRTQSESALHYIEMLGTTKTHECVCTRTCNESGSGWLTGKHELQQINQSEAEQITHLAKLDPSYRHWTIVIITIYSSHKYSALQMEKDRYSVRRASKALSRTTIRWEYLRHNCTIQFDLDSLCHKSRLDSE